MRIHILGICGTFMAGIAVLAKQAGHSVSGSDHAFYPPMNQQLESQGIILHEGYSPEALMPEPDLIIVGNVAKRGNPTVEWMLNHKIPYISGPEWLHQEVLSKQKIILAVAGTHGKTSTSSMLAWILEKAGKKPGFLIGGIPQNFGVSARLGNGECFVVEADEYDTAFFDKRSKLIHYHPDVVILNNLEYDHADIFPDLAAIQKQFHQMIRTIPQKGIILHPEDSPALNETLAMGCWSERQTFGVGKKSQANWTAETLKADGTVFSVKYRGFSDTSDFQANWSLLGEHNVSNGLAAIGAAHAAGVPIKTACDALATFKNVKRRLEIRGKVNNITVYDDFAHHPTAIEATTNALRHHVGPESRIMAVLHLASNSMRMGIYSETLGASLKEANHIVVLKPENAQTLNWIETVDANRVTILESVDEIVAFLAKTLKPYDNVLVMSNGDFSGIHDKLLQKLSDTNDIS